MPLLPLGVLRDGKVSAVGLTRTVGAGREAVTTVSRAGVSAYGAAHSFRVTMDSGGFECRRDDAAPLQAGDGALHLEGGRGV